MRPEIQLQIEMLALIISCLTFLISIFFEGYPKTEEMKALSGISVFVGYLVMRNFLILAYKAIKGVKK